jgi:hypothetical protein
MEGGEIMDNLGGFSKVEFAYVYEILNCYKARNRKYVNLSPGCNWKQFPSRVLGIEFMQTSENGEIFTQNGTIELIKNQISEEMLNKINFIKTDGCVLKLTDSNNQVHIVGSEKYPVLGSLTPIPGKKVSDLNHVVFNWSCHSIDEILQMG